MIMTIQPNISTHVVTLTENSGIILLNMVGTVWNVSSECGGKLSALILRDAIKAL